MCICILSYYTYSGTEYSDDHYTVLHEYWYCLFSYLYPLHHPWGVFCPPPRGGHSPCPPNRGIPLQLFGFRLKMQWPLIHVSNCATFVGTVCIHVWALIGTLSYYFEGSPTDDVTGIPQWCHQGWEFPLIW